MNQRWFILLALIGSSFVQGISAAPGDLTGDSHTDQADLGLLEQYLQGNLLLSEEQVQAGDIDGDGRITAADAAALKGRLGLSVAEGSRLGSQASVDLDSSNSGRVVDRATGQPLAGVVIEVPEEKIRVITDREGRFTLPRPVPANRIMTARAANDFVPFSLTTAKNQQAPFELQLERRARQTLVLDDRVRHLGDNDYSQNSANAGDFRLDSEGYLFKRRFKLDNIPARDPYLRIGSLIGVDTLESRQAGQSHLRGSPALKKGVQVLLNGKMVYRIVLNGDNILIPLPRWLLQTGSNEITLATTSSAPNRSARIFGDLLESFGLNNNESVDYDDLEFAQVVLIFPDP